MDAEILAVGTELLMGQIANTNAQYITSRLQEAGINVYYHIVVGDNPDRLCQTLENCFKRSDIVIMTGGLGPTKDDLTKETVANLFGRKLLAHQPSVDMICSFFKRIGREMTDNNLKQADMPEGAMILGNANGTAPGCIIEENNKAVVLLPGPPSEMKPMFDEYVMPWLSNKSGTVIRSKYLSVFGIGESKLEDMLKDIIDRQDNPTIAPYVKEGVVTLRITAMCKEPSEENKLIEPVIHKIKNRVGDHLFSVDNESLHEVAYRLLVKKNKKIAFAESCTGGLVASTLISLPGASQVINSSVVCYSDEAKSRHLGVKEATLKEYGAVSRQTAEEMAKGVADYAGSDIGLSVTGIAGPDGGTDEKPVGLVYICLFSDGKYYVRELNNTGKRARIQNNAMLHSFDMLRRFLLGLEM